MPRRLGHETGSTFGPLDQHERSPGKGSAEFDRARRASQDTERLGDETEHGQRKSPARGSPQPREADNRKAEGVTTSQRLSG